MCFHSAFLSFDLYNISNVSTTYILLYIIGEDIYVYL